MERYVGCIATSNPIMCSYNDKIIPFQSGGKCLQEGMDDNDTLTKFDLRLSEIGQESEYVINKKVKENLDRDQNKTVT